MTKPSKLEKQRQSIQNSALIFPLLPYYVLPLCFSTSAFIPTVSCKEYLPHPQNIQIITPLAPHSGKKTFTGKFSPLLCQVKGLGGSAEPCGENHPRQRRTGCVLSYPKFPFHVLKAHSFPARKRGSFGQLALLSQQVFFKASPLSTGKVFLSQK